MTVHHIFALLVSLVLLACAGPPQTPPAPDRDAQGQPWSTYAALAEPILTQGREVSDLLVAGDLDALFARFDAPMLAEVPRERLDATVAGFLAQAPIGLLLDARSFLSTAHQPTTSPPTPGATASSASTLPSTTAATFPDWS